MVDDLTFFANGRRPQFYMKNGRQPQFLRNGRNLYFKDNGRQHQFEGKWKTTSIFVLLMEDNLIFLLMEGEFNFF